MIAQKKEAGWGRTKCSDSLKHPPSFPEQTLLQSVFLRRNETENGGGFEKTVKYLCNKSVRNSTGEHLEMQMQVFVL